MSQIYKNLLKELKSSEYSLDKNTINNYCVDWRGKYKGSSEIIFFPKSVLSVIKIVKFCYKKNIPIVPSEPINNCFKSRPVLFFLTVFKSL